MKYNVFDKRPSKKDIAEAMQYSDAQEQMEALAHSTHKGKES